MKMTKDIGISMIAGLRQRAPPLGSSKGYWNCIDVARVLTEEEQLHMECRENQNKTWNHGRSSLIYKNEKKQLPWKHPVTLLVSLMLNVNVHQNNSRANSERLHRATMLRFLKDQTHMTMTRLSLVPPRPFTRQLRTISRGMFTFGLEIKLMSAVAHRVSFLVRFNCACSP